MNTTLLTIVSMIAISTGASAQLHTGDITLHVANSRVVTGAGNPSTGTFVETRIFGATLGNPFPNYTNNPGFDCLAGTFPVGSAVGFNMLDQLLVWNGSTFVPTGGEVMQVSFLSASATTSAGPVAGFTVGVSGTGTWHNHLGYLLQQGSSPTIDSGVYMLELEMYGTAPGYSASKPFFMLFRRNAAQATLDAAAAYVAANYLHPALPGDANGDGLVNFADLNIVISAFNTSGADIPGDLDDDGDVDFADLNEVLSNFNT